MGAATKFFRNLAGSLGLRDQKAAITAGQVKPASGGTVSENEAKDQLRQRRGGSSSAILGAHGAEPALRNKSKMGG